MSAEVDRQFNSEQTIALGYFLRDKVCMKERIGILGRGPDRQITRDHRGNLSSEIGEVVVPAYVFDSFIGEHEVIPVRYRLIPALGPVPFAQITQLEEDSPESRPYHVTLTPPIDLAEESYQQISSELRYGSELYEALVVAICLQTEKREHQPTRQTVQPETPVTPMVQHFKRWLGKINQLPLPSLNLKSTL